MRVSGDPATSGDLFSHNGRTGGGAYQGAKNLTNAALPLSIACA